MEGVEPEFHPFPKGRVPFPKGVLVGGDQEGRCTRGRPSGHMRRRTGQHKDHDMDVEEVGAPRSDGRDQRRVDAGRSAASTNTSKGGHTSNNSRRWVGTVSRSSDVPKGIQTHTHPRRDRRPGVGPTPPPARNHCGLRRATRQVTDGIGEGESAPLPFPRRWIRGRDPSQRSTRIGSSSLSLSRGRTLSTRSSGVSREPSPSTTTHPPEVGFLVSHHPWHLFPSSWIFPVHTRSPSSDVCVRFCREDLPFSPRIPRHVPAFSLGFPLLWKGGMSVHLSGRMVP